MSARDERSVPCRPRLSVDDPEPRERFLSAVERRPAGGISFDLGAGITSFTVGAHERLCSHLGVAPGPSRISARMLQIVYPASAIEAKVCGDLRFIAPGPSSCHPDEEMDDRTFRDEWGLVRRLSSNGYYYDFVQAPLAECGSLDACLAELQLPGDEKTRMRGLGADAARIRAAGYAVGAWCFAGIFEMVFWLRGYKNGYLDFATRPALAEGLMDALLEVQVRFWEALLGSADGKVDVALLTEDLGTQQATMISPKQFHDLVKPRIGALIRAIKAKSPGTKILLHSDGAIFPIIEDLIDIGVDILNPIQPGAEGMDPARIKREYGSDLAFHGAIDIQQVLSRGTEEDVRASVHRMVELLGASGGYIVAPAHCVQPDVPPENVMALVHAVRELERYP